MSRIGELRVSQTAALRKRIDFNLDLDEMADPGAHAADCFRNGASDGCNDRQFTMAGAAHDLHREDPD